MLIKMALKDFDKGSYIDVDLMKFEELFINFHQPLSKTILFLCRECCVKYGGEGEFYTTRNKKTEKVIITTLKDNEKELYLNANFNNNTEYKEMKKVFGRLDRWFYNRNQINSKILYAFINLYKKFNDNVDVHNLETESGVDTFYTNFTQMKNFGDKNHGKVFEQYGCHVYLWEPIEKIVWEKYTKYNSGSNR
jgi:hypothetical protein